MLINTFFSNNIIKLFIYLIYKKYIKVKVMALYLLLYVYLLYTFILTINIFV